MRILSQDKTCIINPIETSCYITPYEIGYALIMVVNNQRFTMGQYLTKQEGFEKLSLIFTNLLFAAPSFRNSAIKSVCVIGVLELSILGTTVSTQNNRLKYKSCLTINLAKCLS